MMQNGVTLPTALSSLENETVMPNREQDVFVVNRVDAVLVRKP